MYSFSSVSQRFKIYLAITFPFAYSIIGGADCISTPQNTFTPKALLLFIKKSFGPNKTKDGVCEVILMHLQFDFQLFWK